MAQKSGFFILTNIRFYGIIPAKGGLQMFTVYKHTFPDKKVYIGQTAQNPKKRWKCGFGYINNDLFFRAIVKYGWDNIQHEILFDGLTKEEANTIEKEQIKLSKSNDPKYGYNIAAGGVGNRGSGKKVVCVETGVIYPAASEAQKETGILKACIGACCRGERITAGGFHWTFADKKIKCDIKQRKINTYKHGKVKCSETGEIYENCIVASQRTGIERSTISKACNHKRNTAGGFHWEYTAR